MVSESAHEWIRKSRSRGIIEEESLMILIARAAMTSDNKILLADKFDHQILMCIYPEGKVYDSCETV